MGVCVFVASGLNFDVDNYLKSNPFKTMAVFRKGDIPPMNNPEKMPRPDSGFVVLVSGDKNPGLGQQLTDAVAFFGEHEQALAGIRQAGVDNMLLDLAVQTGERPQHAQYLPPDLIAAMGRLGMGLIFSIVKHPQA